MLRESKINSYIILALMILSNQYIKEMASDVCSDKLKYFGHRLVLKNSKFDYEIGFSW